MRLAALNPFVTPSAMPGSPLRPRGQNVSERDQAYERWLDGLTIDKIQARFEGQGVTRVVVKRLAPRQDNSKNQVILPGDIAKLGLPMGEFVASETSSKKKSKTQDKYTAAMELHWLTPAGSNPAPRTKVIFYPQYPETRLSGFLTGTVDAPRRLLDRDHVTQNGIEGRFIILGAGTGDPFFGAGSGNAVFGLVVPPTSPAAAALAAMAPPRKLVEWAFSPQEVLATPAELLGELHGIHLMAPVPGMTVRGGLVVPNSAPNAGGTTLETLFGIKPNAIAAPDFRGWELKSYSSSKITLMTPGPTGGRLKVLGIERFFETFGYWSPSKNRFDFNGAHTALRAPKGKAMTEMVVTPDAVALVRRDTQEVGLEWSMAGLLDKWRKKHALAAYVLRTGKAAPGFTYGPTVHLGEGASFTRFQRALEDGTVVLDPAIWFDPTANRRKFRYQIRVNLADLSKLYKAHGVHDVRTYAPSRALAEADLRAAGLVLP